MFISLTLRYLGDNLDPKFVTEALGISPTESQIKGDEIVSQSGKSRFIKKGFWEWSIKSDCSDQAEERDESGILVQLDRLVSSFESSFREVMHILDAQPNCEHFWIDIHVIVDNDGSSISFPLSNKSMRTLSKTGLLIDFTVTN